MSDTVPQPHPERFSQLLSTNWDLVTLAGAGDHEAIHVLTQRFYPVLDAYFQVVVRSRIQEPRDLLHDFVESKFLRNELLRAASDQKGRLRWYVKAAAVNFLRDRKALFQARAPHGEGRDDLSLDALGESGEGLVEAGNGSTRPDVALDQAWIRHLIGRALDQLREELKRSKVKGLLIDPMYERLLDAPEAAGSILLAKQHSMTPQAVDTAIFRLRKRFMSILREMIQDTIKDPNDLEGEIAELLRVFSDNPGA